MHINVGNREDWPDPSYLANQNRAPTLVAVCTSITMLAFSVVCLRLYSRARIVKIVGVDDVMMSIAMCFSLGMLAMQITGAIKYGNYRHVWTLSDAHVLGAHKMVILLTTFYPYILGFIKVSILFFYLRLSVDPGFRYVVWSMIGIVTTLTLGTSLALLFQCTPVVNSWSLGKPYHCVNRPALQYSVATLNISTDIIVLLLSWVMCMDLNIPRKDKFALLGVFSVGLFVCVCSGLRFSALHTYWTSLDQTWHVFYASIFSCLEANLSICAASVPALKPFFRRFYKDEENTMVVNSVAKSDYMDTYASMAQSPAVVKSYKNFDWDELTLNESRRSVGTRDLANLGVLPDASEMDLGVREIQEVKP